MIDRLYGPVGKNSVGADLVYGLENIGKAPPVSPGTDPFYGLGIRGAWNYLQTLRWIKDNTVDAPSDPEVAINLGGARQTAVQYWDIILKSMALPTPMPPYEQVPVAQYGAPTSEWDKFLNARYSGVWGGIVGATNAMRNNGELISAAPPVGPSPPVARPQPDATAAAPAEEKSNLLWWLLGGVVVVGAGAYALYGKPSRRR